MAVSKQLFVFNNMINEHNTYAFCSEDISKIENYDKAIADKTYTWHCHHRAEILPCGRYSRESLKRFGLYYNQPANRLIFLLPKEHKHIHYAGQKLSEETRKKISISLTGKKQSEQTRQKRANSLKGHRPWSRGKIGPNKGRTFDKEARKHMSEAHKGKPPPNKCKHLSNEQKEKLLKANFGSHWFNNGIEEKRAKSCPDGFVKGRLKRL